MLLMWLLGVEKDDVGMVEVAPLSECLSSNATSFECPIVFETS